MFTIIFKNLFRKKIVQQKPKIDKQMIYFEQITKKLDKLDKFDKLETKLIELQLTIEDLQDSIENNSEQIVDLKQDNELETSSLVNSLIAAGDMIEDFWAYAKQSGSEALETQANMMWQTFIKKCSSSNLIRIQNEGTKPDPKYDTTTSSDYNDEIPKGHIIYNLRSGYLYDNKLVRKSNVVISNGKKIISLEDNNHDNRH